MTHAEKLIQGRLQPRSRGGNLDLTVVAVTLLDFALCAIEIRSALRLYKEGFVWWRPDGAAYEFTLAALGQRVEQLGLGRAARQARARS